MDKLETPYDDEASNEFIECAVCDKSIRGTTLYKIHLTTPGHLKKEDFLVAAGRYSREKIIPVFEDILQYLDYLQLDEPIIGLSSLEELPSNDPHGGPKYLCKLCNHTGNLSEMAHHLIGRKHRQKYVELKRPDLVTWDKQSIITQGGKIIRARAEIIERQDGRGHPVLMKKTGFMGKLNISKVPSRQRDNDIRSIPERLRQHDLPPEHRDFQDEYSHRGGYRPGHSNTPPFHPDGPHTLKTDRDTHSQDGRMKNELWWTDDEQSDVCRREYKDSDCRGEYEDACYSRNPQTRGALQLDDGPRYDSRNDTLHGGVHDAECYPDETPPYTRSCPEKDPLKEFYSEEVCRGRGSSEYEPSQRRYPEDDEHQWSLDRKSRSSEPESKRRSFPLLLERERPHEGFIIRDYQHEMREPYHEESVVNPGPSRTGSTTLQTQRNVNRTISDMPEPFRRFLKGAMNDESPGKRKRKSRFSDATAEELESVNKMFNDGYGPPEPKFGGQSRPGSFAYEPEVHGTHHSDLYTESQSSHQTESYQTGDSGGGGGVFDLLKDIEIENAEEANFLKNKLCSLLKEFKAKKSEKAAQGNQSHTVISKEYNNLKPELQRPPQRLYGRNLSEDSDIRRPEDLFIGDHTDRGWKQRENIPDERDQEYHHSARVESRQSNRYRYEETFGRPEMHLTQHSIGADERVCSERFQAQMLQPRDYRPPAKEVFDSGPSAPHFDMERGPRMQNGPRYSSNLDKITSTLLELVSRK